MKKDKENCKKGKESTIGKIIYGFLMFMPLLAIGFTCLYAVFNKNAYKSNGNKYVDKAITLNNSNINDLYVNGQLITYTFNEHNTQWNAIFGFSKISIDLNEIFNTELTYNKFYLYANNTDIMFYDTNGGTHRLTKSQRNFETFTYMVDLTPSTDNGIYNYGLAQVFTYNERALTDTFYYAINQIEESPLFNWATNSSLYNVVNNTCAELSITTTFVPLLLTYWLIISLIYFIYDIVLIILNILHRKIHELQDSI